MDGSLLERGRVSVGVGSSRNSLDLAENLANLVEIRRIRPKTGREWRDLAGSLLDFVGSSEIRLRNLQMVEISGLIGGGVDWVS